MKNINNNDMGKNNTEKKSATYTLHGVTGTLAELCRHFKKDYNMVYFRLKRGMSVEEAFSQPIRVQTRYTYNGKTGTLTELCKYFGYNYKRISKYISQGQTIEQAVANSSKRSRPSHSQASSAYVQKRTISLSKTCSHYNVNYAAVRSRIRSGMSSEEALNKPIRQYKTIYTYDGGPEPITGTLQYICSQLNKNYSTVKYRLNSGLSLKEAIEKENPPVKEYSYGDTTGTLAELCNLYNKERRVIAERLKRGMTIEDAFEL